MSDEQVKRTHKHSEETKAKLKIANTGKKQTEESKHTISVAVQSAAAARKGMTLEAYQKERNKQIAVADAQRELKVKMRQDRLEAYQNRTPAKRGRKPKQQTTA